MTVRHIVAREQARDLLGNVAPGAKRRYYDPGTTNPRAVYSDSARTIPFVQPIEADSAGFLPQIYLPDSVYKYTTHTSGDVLIETHDNVDPGLSTSAGALAITAGGTGATTAAGARTNLSVPSQAAFDALDLRVADAESLLDNPILAASVSVTFAASLTVDFTADETRHVTLTGNITALNAPTVTAGQKVRLILIQDAAGNRTWVTNSAWKFPGDVVPPLSTTANAVDVLEGYARTTGEIQVTSFKRQDPLVPYAILEDQKTSGTNGGTFTSGADRTRDLNTEVSDLAGIVSLSANQFTLNAGTYRIDWSAPANISGPGNHQSMLYNATDAAIVQRGANIGPLDGVGISRGSAIVTISATKAFEIRHRCNTTTSNTGFGTALSFGTEVYTQVIIRKFP